jgi:uncharacterized membrane protein
MKSTLDWGVHLHDAVAVYGNYGGRLRVDQSYLMATGEGAAWGTLWGTLIGATPVIPFTAGRLRRCPRCLFLEGGVRISEEIVRQVGAMIQPGDSGIFSLL